MLFECIGPPFVPPVALVTGTAGFETDILSGYDMMMTFFDLNLSLCTPCSVKVIV